MTCVNLLALPVSMPHELTLPKKESLAELPADERECDGARPGAIIFGVRLDSFPNEIFTREGFKAEVSSVSNEGKSRVL